MTYEQRRTTVERDVADRVYPGSRDMGALR
jgi:hypothetical protein